jgi:electron transport complex protein RnfG
LSVKEPTFFRLVMTLAITGLLSGLVLVCIYLVTQPLILRNQAEAMRKAIYRVLPGAESISTFVVEEGGLVPFEAVGDEMPAGDAVFAGRLGDGRLIGYAIPAAGAGFMDTVKLIYGYDPARRAIIGMQVLDSKETPGLGDKIIFDEHFHQNFVELKVEPEIVGVKRGEKVNPNEVDTITGATISSNAVITILNDGSQKWLPLLETLESDEVKP